MVTIRIADYVLHASTYDDGNVIYELIAPEIKAGRPVEVSFEGIQAVPSAFINAALVRLVDDLPVPVIRQRLRISDSTRYINDMIRSRFAFLEGRKPVSAA